MTWTHNQRFESGETGHVWPHEKYTFVLHLRLTEEAWTVVGARCVTGSVQYPKVELSLLEHFQYTVQEYQEIIRSTKPDVVEIRRKLATRLAGLFSGVGGAGESGNYFSLLKDSQMFQYYGFFL